MQIALGVAGGIGHPCTCAADILGRGPAIPIEPAPHDVRRGILMFHPDEVQIALAIANQLMEEIRPTAVRKLTNGGGPNFFHKLIRDRKGNLHLVWVEHQNATSHIMWSRLDGDRWSTPQDISGAGAWMPDAACDSKGDLHVAWDSYRTGNYDIFVRRIGADGALGPIQQVTKSSRFQAHASVAVDQNDRVWLAWDESGSNWGKDYARDDTWRGTPLYGDRRPRLAILENGRGSAPVADPMAAIPSRY